MPGRARWGTALAVAAITALGAWIRVSAQTSAEREDKYQWLEDVTGARSMAWVRAQNERSAKVLESDPHYPSFERTALKVLESPDRLATPDINGQDIYNVWQDAAHVQGILRRTSVNDYLNAQPHWTTVLDYDALSKQDRQKWVQKGRTCLYPGNELCLVALSAGGEDAVTEREFNLKTAQFVSNGFVLPRSKQAIAWLDKDTLLVARDWGPGTMTKSGYPFVIKMLKRGQALAQAREVYRGVETDMIAEMETLHDGAGHQATLVHRQLNFFETVSSLFTPDGVEKTALPLKSSVEGLVNDHLIVTIDEDWTPDGTPKKIAQGSIVSFDLNEVTKDPLHLKPTIVFAPTAVEFAQQVYTTKNRLVVTTLENVQGRAYSYVLDARSAWTCQRLHVPDNLSVSVATANWSDDRFFLSLSGFLTPSSLWFGDAAANTIREAKTLPPQFDASRDVVEQFEAVSKDGTKVPYFVIRPKNMRFDGANPTLLNAYGGFQVSSTPSYRAVFGKLWLERGGVFVLANIRGGGEFGPAWHEAGLKTHRQRIYDDFAAVGQDLVTRHITSPRRLGILGGSNGGLLMGVEMTQHPEMWNAVAIMVPLLDMLRFEQIAAGSSWTGEYGSVSVPAERAFLASISPYSQLKPGVNYPEPLIFTTTKDDRVGPVHARKFAAKMEEFHEPFLYQEIIEGGHGAGADLREEATTNAILFTYLTRKLMN